MDIGVGLGLSSQTQACLMRIMLSTQIGTVAVVSCANWSVVRIGQWCELVSGAIVDMAGVIQVIAVGLTVLK